MLRTGCFIDNPTSTGGSNYSLQLYFGTVSQAKYLNVGDRIQDSASHQYEVIGATLPFTDGGTISVTALGGAGSPTQDLDYNSHIYTPGQAQLYPDFKTAGEISSSSVYNATAFEYTIATGWTSSSDANKAAIGDYIVDSTGKAYEITYIDPVNRFNVSIRATEVDRTGAAPSAGTATMYRPTGTRKLFQGTELTTAARNVIKNRDSAYLDLVSFKAPTVVKRWVMAEACSAYQPLAKKSDGKGYKSESDGSGVQNVHAISLQSSIGEGDIIDVALVSYNLVGVLAGLGFAPGDKVFIGETPGSFVNDISGFSGNNDSILWAGWADCAEGIASAQATDLIYDFEVIGRPG